MRLIDEHARAVTYLRLSVTDRCNLRCQYCMPAEGLRWMPDAALMQDDEIVRLVETVFLPLGVSRIRLTGGEPTVRRGLPALIGRIAELPGIEDVSLSTNGVLFAPHADAFAAAGLDRINVSLDSLRPDRFAAITRGGKLERVLAALDAALRVGLAAVKVNVVIIPGTNDDEVLDFAALTRDRPLHVRFIEMMQVGNREYFNAKGYLAAADLEAEVRATFGLEPADGAVMGNGPAVVMRIPGGAGTVGFISPMSRTFCHTCNRTRLTADGQLKACLMRPQEVDLLGALRRGEPAERLQEMVLHSLGAKPLHHEWGADQPITRTMSQIGG